MDTSLLIGMQLFVGYVPDVVGVLGDGAVSGEDAAAGDVVETHAVPFNRVGVGFHHALLRLAVGGKVRQKQILVGGAAAEP